MKFKYLILILTISLFSCSDDKNSPEFVKETTGRYLFNANEVIEIHFEDAVLFAKWRGKENIKPLKLNDSSFYMAEMNEKFVFYKNPPRIELVEKTEHKGVKYVFDKLSENEKTPNEYLENGEFDKAVEAFLLIKEQDSLNPIIQEYQFNRLGYNYLNDNEYDKAIQIFTINTILYPTKSNVYDSLADAYWRKKDTANAKENYKKALSINPENETATRFLKKHNLE